MTNATRLLVEDPDDLDVGGQRDADKAEVRRIEAEIASQKSPAPRALPDHKALGAAVVTFLDVVTNQAPERGREILARCMSPLTITEKSKVPTVLKWLGPWTSAPLQLRQRMEVAGERFARVSTRFIELFALSVCLE